jgi:flagellar hook-associated protein 2
VTQSISGLVSGLDTESIIQQLLAIERQSGNVLKSRQNQAKERLTSYAAIRDVLTPLRTAALALSHATDWQPLSATSSQPDAVSVSAGAGSLSGALTFTVDRLASAGTYRSTNVLASTGAAIAADNAVMVAAGGKAYGFASFASDATLSIGNHTITVTQASSGATKTGSNPVAASTVVDGTNDTLQLDVDGVAKTLTIAHGTYDPSQLAAAVQTAADAAGAAVFATYDGAAGHLVLTTAREGIVASIAVTGGNALGALGLTAGAGTAGTAGKVQVDGGAEQTLNDVNPGASVVLNAPAGTVTAVISGGLRAGSLTVKNVATGDGSLATVAANINNAGAGVTASVVQVGPNAYRLQISSNSVGAANDANVAASEFNGAIGGLVQLTAAADAQVTVGSGPGAYTVTSSTNTVSGLLPGVTLNLKATTAAPVTVTVGRDAGKLADKVEALVEAANKVKKAIDAVTRYDPDTKQGSPLTGDASARRVITTLQTALSSAVPWANPGSPGLAGLSVDKEGTFTFDRAKFSAAFDADPTGMTRAFTQGGTGTDPNVTFVSAADRARAGSYAVVVTEVASQASAVGLQGSWPMPSPPTVKVKIGNAEVSYVVKPGDSQIDVVNGLNAAFASGKLSLQASVSGTGVEIHSQAYGSSATFDVAWDGTNFTTHTGTDVQGTIGGKTATGSGQQLSIPFDDTLIPGLALNITATTPGALGTFSYQPGVAQRVVSALADATDLVSGYITGSEKSLKARVTFIDKQVESMEVRIALRERSLRRQFSDLESRLGALRSQSEWLAGQLAGLGTFGSQ